MKKLMLFIIICAIPIVIFFSAHIILDFMWFSAQGFINTAMRFLIFKWLAVPIFAIVMSFIGLFYLSLTTTKRNNRSSLWLQIFVIFLFSLIFEYKSNIIQDFIYSIIGGLTGKSDLLTHLDLSFYLLWLPFFKKISLYMIFFFSVPIIFDMLGLCVDKIKKVSISLLLFGLASYLIFIRIEITPMLAKGEYIGFLDLYAGLIPFMISVLLVFVFILTVLWIFSIHSRYAVIGSGIVAGIVILLNSALPYYLENFVYNPNKSSVQTSFAGIFADATRKSFQLDELLYSDDFLLTTNNIETIISNNFWNNQDNFVSAVQKNQEILPIFSIECASPMLLSYNQQYLPSFIAARNISEEQNNDWDIKHFRNIFGYGAVIGSAIEFDSDGYPKLFLKDLNQNNSNIFSLKNPQVFFSDMYSNFVFINSKMLLPDFTINPPQLQEQSFSDIKAIPVNWFVRIILSMLYKDQRFLLTDYILDNTHLILHRKPSDIVNKMLPMFKFSTPELIYQNEELWWVLDGYTVSDNVFLSKKVTTPWGKFNWVRSPLKAYLSAYSGELIFDVIDPQNPYVRIAQKLFPRLFEKKSDFGAETYLYPKELFKIQSELLTRFHDTNTPNFYAQLNINQISTPLNSTEPENIKYVFLDQITRLAYQRTYTPKDKNIFSARLLGLIDKDKKQRLYYYQADLNNGIPGLAQAEAFLNQDQQFSGLKTLWDQRGSKISSSDMMFYPMKDGGIYFRTIFLESEGISIPLATRFIAANSTKILLANSPQQLIVQSDAILAGVPEKSQSTLQKLQKLSIEAYQYYLNAQSARANANTQEYNDNVDKIGDILKNMNFTE